MFVNCEACGKAGVPRDQKYITPFGLKSLCGDKCFRIMNIETDLESIKRLARRGGNDVK
jgi:hypothetical protein